MSDYIPIICLAVLVVLDVVFGLCKAYVQGNISSTKMREGALHKMTYVGLLALAYIVEVEQAHIDLGINVPIVNPVCIFLSLTEVTSIIENICVINPQFAESNIGKFFDFKRKLK